MSYEYLSYALSENTPGYAGRSDFSFECTKSMSKGDSCNQQEWKLSNHVGTHVDAPSHFSAKGKSVDEFGPDFWIANNPFMLDIPATPGELIDLNFYSKDIPKDCDFLIIKTNFEKYRSENKYWEENPGISPASGSFLRMNFAQLKFIGFDFISLTSFQHRR